MPDYRAYKVGTDGHIISFFFDGHLTTMPPQLLMRSS